METRVITSATLKFKDKILILKRSDNAHFNPRIWDTIGGHLKEYDTAEENILREAKEETGLDVEIIDEPKSYEIEDKNGRWVVIPFLLQATNDDVKLNPEEHSEYKWISPEEVSKYERVPDLDKNLKLFGLIK